MDRLLALEVEGGALHGELGWLAQILEWAATGVDLVAIFIMLIGALRFIVGYLRTELRRDSARRVQGINRERVELGRYILASLELLIVSDIMHTALSLRFADLVYLGLLVAIRSLISYFLGRELQEVRAELDAPPPDRD